MKIGIDYAATIGYGGNSVYSQNLIDNILSIDSSNDYYLYAFAHDVFMGRINSFKNNKRIHLRPVYFSSLGLPVPEFLIKWVNHVSFYIWTTIDNLDIFHFTNPVYYERGKHKSLIITIHDLSGLYSEGWSKKGSADFFKREINEMVDQANKIIAVSEYTKNDIVQTLRVESEKLKVIYEAAGEVYYPDLKPILIKDKFNLSDYLLYVGQLQPRKNIVNMLIAYSRLPTEIKEKYSLVLVGSARDNSYAEIVNRTIAENNLTPYVRILGRLDVEDVRRLYSGARAFVFPSLFEGFGLPILESLQCGTPVVTSSVTSLPEIVGNAGILVNPLDINDLAQALQKMLVDDGLYGTLRNRCVSQAKKFSWEKAARETIYLYETLRL